MIQIWVGFEGRRASVSNRERTALRSTRSRRLESCGVERLFGSHWLEYSCQ